MDTGTCETDFQKIDLLILELKRCAAVLKKYPANKPMREKYEALLGVINSHLDEIPETLTHSFAYWEIQR